MTSVEIKKRNNEAESGVSTADTSPITEKSCSSRRENICLAISYILNEIIDENEASKKMYTKQQKEIEKNDIFRGRKIPSISVEKFLLRILKYTNLEESTLTMSLVYLDRYCELTTVKLSNLNIHRLILLSITTAIKYNEDNHYKNEFYAKIGGIPIEEYVFLEYGFLKGITYSLYVAESLYKKYESYLEQFKAESIRGH